MWKTYASANVDYLSERLIQKEDAFSALVIIPKRQHAVNVTPGFHPYEDPFFIMQTPKLPKTVTCLNLFLEKLAFYHYIGTMSQLYFLIVILFAFASPLFAGDATVINLVLGAESAQPGKTIQAGLQVQLREGWHVYWINPGDSGKALSVEWNLPKGVTAGPLRWPTPTKHEQDGVICYILEKSALMPVSFSLDATVTEGPVELTGKLEWLECKESCVVQETVVKARLLISKTAPEAALPSMLADGIKLLPTTNYPDPFSFQWEPANATKKRAFTLSLSNTNHGTLWDFYPHANPNYEVLASTERLAQSNRVVLKKEVEVPNKAWPDAIAGLLVVTNQGKLVGYDVLLQSDTAKTAADTNTNLNKSSTGSNPAEPPQSLFWILIFAFLGGLILNAMPCVLPVIALKILSFVNQSKESPARIRQMGLSYAAGVLTLFLAMSLLIIVIKQAGNQVGWGMQFGNPQFLVVLCVLVTLVALNLFGVFEVYLGGEVLGNVGKVTSKEGLLGAYFNGALAAILATPCTAPYLGSAMGFAFAQPSSIVVVLIFLMAGLGLASPYVVLCYQPKWLKFLPKPGVWMNQFKTAMGFPMLATAIWLYSVTEAHYGRKTWWLGIFLVGLALAAWIFGQFIQGKPRTFSAWILLTVVLVFDYTWVLDGQLQWRHPYTGEQNASSLQESADGIAWKAWSADAVAEARKAGKPILVDFTADWCATCQANKKISIEISSVRQKIKDINAVALLGDYTKTPPVMTAELNRFGRSGVPLVLVYPKDISKDPIVLPVLLTPSIVLEALDKSVL